MVTCRSSDLQVEKTELVCGLDSLTCSESVRQVMSRKNRVVQATLSVNLGEAENPSSEGAMAKRQGSEAEMFCKNRKNR